MDDPEKVLDEEFRRKFDHLDDLGLTAQTTMRLPSDTFEVILELPLGCSQALELFCERAGGLGRVLAKGRTETEGWLQAVIGAGLFNKMPAVLEVRVTELDAGQSRIVVSSISKEGVIKQSAAEGAARRLLNAANLPASASARSKASQLSAVMSGGEPRLRGSKVKALLQTASLLVLALVAIVVIFFVVIAALLSGVLA